MRAAASGISEDKPSLAGCKVIERNCKGIDSKSVSKVLSLSKDMQSSTDSALMSTQSMY